MIYNTTLGKTYLDNVRCKYNHTYVTTTRSTQKNVQYNSTPLYVYVCIFDYLFLFSLMMLKRNITYRNTVVHKKSNASFLFFFLHVSKRQDRHFIVSQNASTSEPCFTVSYQLSARLSYHLFFPFYSARHVKDNYVGLIAKNTRDTDKQFALGKMFLSTK